MISGVALSQNFHRVTDQEANLDTQMLEGRSLLIVQAKPAAFQFPPCGATKFKSTDNVGIYMEIYDPLLTARSRQTYLRSFAWWKSQTVRRRSIPVESPSANFIRKGSPVVPVGLEAAAEHAHRRSLPAGDDRRRFRRPPDGALHLLRRPVTAPGGSMNRIKFVKAAAASPAAAAWVRRRASKPHAKIVRLNLRHTWTTTMSSSEYRDTLHLAYSRDGITGHGEGAPIVRYHEDAEARARPSNRCATCCSARPDAVHARSWPRSSGASRARGPARPPSISP